MSAIKIPKIYFNAEFQRLMWLNFSLPLLCVIIFCYGFFSYNSINYHDGYRFDHLWPVAWVGFCISNIAMAIMLQRSFKQDIQSQFWDQLRMSTLTSWQLSWTRLFITPILAWASLIVCMLLTYLSVVLYVPDSKKYGYSLFSEEAKQHILHLVLMMPMFTICCASLFIINELQFKRSQYEWNGTYFQLGLLAVVGGFFLNSAVDKFHYNSDLALLPFFNNHTDFNIWHLLSYAVLATVIALFLLNKSMSYKLHLKSTHIYWLMITLCLPYILVLIDSLFLPNSLTTGTYDYTAEKYIDISFAKSSALMYYFSAYSVLIYSVACGISLICQDNRPQTFSLAWQYLKAKQLRKMLDILPIWVILLPVALMTMGLLAVIIPMVDANFYQTVIQQNRFDDNKHFGFASFAYQLVIYMTVIFALYHLSRKTAPRFNSVTLSLIGFILLYVMWQIVMKF